MWRTISGGHTWKGRMVNKRKDGAFYTEDATISPVFDATGKIVNYVAVKRDITEHLRLADQFQQSQKMESVGRLAGGVAHDFNNLLTVIMGYSELLLQKIGKETSMYRDVEEIKRAGEPGGVADAAATGVLPEADHRAEDYSVRRSDRGDATRC